MKCPYCHEEGSIPVADIEITVTLRTLAVMRNGTVDFELLDEEELDVIDDAIGASAVPVFHCSECEHELSNEQVKPMLTNRDNNKESAI